MGNYVILTSDEPGPFCTIMASGNDPVAFQVPHAWAERIVIALKLLDIQERDSRISEYVEKIKQEMKND